MADIASISAALTSIKTATELARFIRGNEASLKDAETKLKLAELINALADAKIDIAEIQDSLQEKEAKIRELHAQLETRTEIVWDQPYYWLGAKAQGNGPYCQRCYDADDKLVRLQGYGNGFWDCKVCESNYTDSTYSPEPPIGFSISRGFDDY